MLNASLHQELVELLCGRGHTGKALTEGHHSEAHPLQVLRHLRGTPAVKGNLQNVVLLAQFFDELLDEAVVDDIALCGVEIALLMPHIIGYGGAPDPQRNCVLRYPEVREQDVLLLLRPGREDEHERRDIAGAGQVQTAVAFASFQRGKVDGFLAQVVDVFRDKTGQAGHPHVQTKLLEHIFLRRIVQRLPVHVPHPVDLDGLAQTGIGLVPVLLGVPVIVIGKAVDHRVKGRVDFPSRQNVLRLLMQLVADGLAVGSGCGNQEVQRLFPGVAGAFGEHVVELSVGLCVQLVEHEAADVQAVLGGNLGGKHLIEPGVAVIHDAFGRCHDLGALEQRRTHLNHLVRNIKDDAGLLPVRRRAVDLGGRLVVGVEQIQSHRSSQLALPIFLADFHEGGPKLPPALGVYDAEHIPNHLLLPGKQPEGFASPFALGVFQIFNKPDCSGGFFLVIVRCGEHKAAGNILLQLWYPLGPLLLHQPPPRSSSISSSVPFSSFPAMILERDDGVSPNSVASLVMILL